jgi:hypothetical protein
MQNIKDRKIVLVNIVGYCEGGGGWGCYSARAHVSVKVQIKNLFEKTPSR